jgi:hypothetical protein
MTGNEHEGLIGSSALTDPTTQRPVINISCEHCKEECWMPSVAVAELQLCGVWLCKFHYNRIVYGVGVYVFDQVQRRLHSWERDKNEP